MAWVTVFIHSDGPIGFDPSLCVAGSRANASNNSMNFENDYD